MSTLTTPRFNNELYNQEGDYADGYDTGINFVVTHIPVDGREHYVSEEWLLGYLDAEHDKKLDI